MGLPGEDRLADGTGIRPPVKGQWAFGLALGGLLLLAFAVRLALAGYSLWFDDYASLIFADQPQSRLWSLWMAREANPPLFYSLLRIWRGLGADGIVTLRLLPIAAGTLHVAVVAWICQRWHSRTAALVAALLLALSMQHVLVTHMVRGYALAMLGSSVALAGLLLWWDGGRGRLPGMGLFVLGSLLAFYTHTTLILWLGIGPAALVLCHWRAFFRDGVRMATGMRTRGALWRDLAAMVAVSCLGASWWVWVLLHRPAEAAENTSWIVHFNFVQTVFKFLQNGQLLGFVSAAEFPLMVAGTAFIIAMAGFGRHVHAGAPVLRDRGALPAGLVGGFRVSAGCDAAHRAVADEYARHHHGLRYRRTASGSGAAGGGGGYGRSACPEPGIAPAEFRDRGLGCRADARGGAALKCPAGAA